MHADRIWRAFRKANVAGILIEFGGIEKPMRLKGELLRQFLEMMRGNKLDERIGPWLAGMREVAEFRAQGGAQEDIG